MIFAELKNYVLAKADSAAWQEIRTRAGVGPTLFLTMREYPDADATALVAGAARYFGTDVRTLLTEFGTFLAPDLLAMYKPLIKPAWRTLDVIEHTENLMHAAVRINHPEARPPYLQITRTNPHQIVVHYDSPRRMCALARGISQGIARHYGEAILINEPFCMERGDPACRIIVQLRI